MPNPVVVFPRAAFQWLGGAPRTHGTVSDSGVEVARFFQAGERTIRRRWESALLRLNERLRL